MNATRFYRLKLPDLPHGDYANMLVHGMASRSKSGVLELERSGPFIPPISQPSEMVVITAAFLVELQASGLQAIEVAPVTKKRVPQIHWLKWDPYGSEEWKYLVADEEYPIYNYVSEKARDWLLEKAPEWVAFETERVQ